MKKLNIAEGFSLPVDAITQRISFLGRTGSGKTYSAGVLVEEALRLEQQVVVLDPKSDWFGLRLAKNGKDPGFKITILGGEHGDIPLEPTAGALIADMVVDTRVSLILDLSSFESKAEENRFATDFADRLYRRKATHKSPLMLVIDEADQFIPQSPMPDERKMLSRFDTIARRGRGRGVGLVLCSQRSAAIHKGALSQTELLVAHQTTSPHDRKAIMDWIREKANKEQEQEFLDRLAKLKKGNALWWSPSWLEIFRELRVRPKITFDSGKTPEVGDTIRQPKQLAPVDLEVLKKHMAATIEKAKQTDPKELQKQIFDLKRQMAIKDRTVAQVQAMPKTIEKLVEKVVKVEVPVISPKHEKFLDEALARLVQLRTRFEDECENIRECFRDLQCNIGKFKMPESPAFSVARQVGVHPATRIATPATITIKTDPVRPLPKIYLDDQPENGDWKPTPAQLKILKALSSFEAIGQTPTTKSWVAALAGVSNRSGGFKNNLGALRSHELIDYPVAGSIALTDQGRALCPPVAMPLSNQEMLQACLDVLTPAQARILIAVHELWPHPITKADLAVKVQVPVTSGGFKNNLGALRSAGMIDYPQSGMVRCSSWLYVEEHASA